jgi:hypothetical protein
MKLYEYCGEDEHGEEISKIIAEHDNPEELKALGWKKCRERGIENAMWISGPKSWQELVSDGKIHYFIRP